MSELFREGYKHQHLNKNNKSPREVILSDSSDLYNTL